MKHIVWMAAGMAVVVLAGCRTAPDPVQQEMVAQLKEVNASLRKIAENVSATPVPVGGMRTADLNLLARIAPLPDNPTDEDIRRYIVAIQQASAKQNSVSPDDPQVAMLRLIGPGHLNAVLPYFSPGVQSFHLGYAIDSLVGDGDKEEVLKLMPQYPVLINAIIKKKWTADAKEQVFQAAQSTRNVYLLLEALKTYTQTPEDRQRLVELYLSRPEYCYLFDTIKRLPDVDMTALTIQAWANQQHDSGYDWYRTIAAARAAACGDKDALEQAILLLVGESSGRGLSVNQEAMQLLTQATRQMPNPEAMLKWYNENADKLVFDKNKGCWVVK